MQKNVDKALGDLGIEWLKKRYINSLSGGERQMVYIARALVQQLKVIVLDEPTSALDFGNTLKIIDLLCELRELGYAIVLTCHNPDFPLAFKDYTAAIMPNHQVIYGESEKILTDDVLSKIYNVPIKRVKLGDNYICVKA